MFYESNHPYEETVLNKLSETQKMAAVAFIYASEVMGEGHIGFWDLYGNYINHSTITAALKEISVSDKFIKIIEDMPEDFTPVAEIADRCCIEEDFEMVMEQIGEIYDEFEKHGKDGSSLEAHTDFDARLYWSIRFYPKGAENHLEPNNGVQIDNTKNLIVLYDSGMRREIVFAQE